MSQGGFARCLGFTLVQEGGFVDDPRDAGGATNMGITLATLRDWRGDDSLGVAAIRSLGKDEAGAIYGTRFWNIVRGDDLPEGLDLLLFDFAVPSGPPNAAKILQRAIGATVDGWIGDETLEKAHAAFGANEYALFRSITSKQSAFYQGCKTFPTFGRGWMARLKRREESSYKMAGLRAPM